MADQSDVEVKFGADTHELVTATTGMRDIVGEMEAIDSAGSKVTDTTKEMAAGFSGLRLQTANATREIVVLGHELVSGNFTRVPGSLIVLAQRMGGLSLAAYGAIGGIAALAFGIGEMVTQAERGAEALDQIQNLGALAGRGAVDDSAITSLVDKLKEMRGVSESVAEQMAGQLVGSARLTSNEIEFLVNNVEKFAHMSGTDVPSAMKELSKALENPLTQFKELDEHYNLLTTNQYAQIEGFKETGNAAAAAGVLMEGLGDRLASVTDRTTPLSASWHNLGIAWSSLMTSMGDSAPIKWLIDTAIPGMLDGISKLISRIHALADGFRLLADVVTLNFKGASEQIAKMSEDLANVKPSTASGSTQIPNSDANNQVAKEQFENNRRLRVEDDADARTSAEKQYQFTVETTKLAYDQKKISLEQERDAELQALAAEHAAIESSLTDELALYQEGSREYKKIKDQMLDADKQYQIDKTRILVQYTQQSNAAAKKEESEWSKAFNELDRDFQRMTLDWLKGTSTFGQSFQRFAQQMVSEFVSAIATMLVKWLALKAAMAAGIQVGNITGGQGGGASSSIMQQLATAILSLIGVDFISQTSTDANSIAVTANTTALAANTTALIASKAIPGFAVGSPYVPNDMVAQIHKGEMIIPAGAAESLRQGTASVGGYSQSSPDVHFHVNSLDSASTAKMFQRHSRAISNAVAAAARGGHGPMRAAFGKM